MLNRCQYAVTGAYCSNTGLNSTLFSSCILTLVQGLDKELILKKKKKDTSKDTSKDEILVVFEDP